MGGIKKNQQLLFMVLMSEALGNLTALLNTSESGTPAAAEVEQR